MPDIDLANIELLTDSHRSSIAVNWVHIDADGTYDIPVSLWLPPGATDIAAVAKFTTWDSAAVVVTEITAVGVDSADTFLLSAGFNASNGTMVATSSRADGLYGKLRLSLGASGVVGSNIYHMALTATCADKF